VRHRVYGKHLSRDKNERVALFKSLIGSLFINGSIETTESKAKAVKGLVDKIITQAKSKETQRLIRTFLVNRQIEEKLIKEIAPALKTRNSGYTSVIRLGQRSGDGAMVVRMSLLGNISKGLPDKKVSKEEKVLEMSKGKEKLETKLETKKVVVKKQEAKKK
jgi:large subunit ribosomal protein L17